MLSYLVAARKAQELENSPIIFHHDGDRLLCQLAFDPDCISIMKESNAFDVKGYVSASAISMLSIAAHFSRHESEAEVAYQK